MGLFLKREEIIDFIKSNSLYDGTEKVIWANLNSSRGAPVVVIFNEAGILTLPITSMGKIQGDIITVAKEDIQSVTFKKGLMAYKIIVKTKDNEVPNFRVNKVMLGYGEQKEELERLLKMYK